MRTNKLFLILSIVLMLSGISFAEDYVDGKKFDEFEVTQWDGIDAPSVSSANSGRIYYDTTADKLKVSLNGGAYSDLGGAGTWGSIGGTLSNQTDLYASLLLKAPIDHQHPQYNSSAIFAAIDHQHPLYGAADHQHNTSYPSESRFSTLYNIATTNAHPNYQPIGSYADATHQHPNYLTYVDTSKIANAHAVATTASAGFAPILSNVATEFLNGTGAYSTPAGGYVDTSKIANAHALATTSTAGFAPILSNVATQFLNGTGAYSTPAGGGGGGGGSIIGSVPFQALAAPQALQGIEQLRHQTQSYQNYGEIVVDGLIDQTGTRSPADGLTYTGSSTYQYSIGGIDAYTKLLIHYNGADSGQTYTAETGQTVSFVVTAQLDTAQKKFGESSLLVDGNSDYCTVPDSDDWDFGSGDFTIEAFVYWNNLADYQVIMANGDASTYGWVLRKTDAHKIQAYCVKSGPGYIEPISTGTVTTGQWYHIALVRNGSSWKIYIDGTNDGSATDANAIVNSAQLLCMGRGPAGSSYVNGWIDEVRVSKGIARYTANFTPPSKEFGIGISGSLHTLVFPMPITPTHMGVVVKMDSAFTSNQHQYLRCEVSRDGVSYTDCHPITKIGTAGYYRAEMADVTGTGATGTAKITLSGSTTNTLKGYGLYGE